MSGITYLCDRVFTPGFHTPDIYGLHVILPHDATVLDDSIFDSIDILNYRGHLVFEHRGRGAITINLSAEKLAEFKLKTLCFKLKCEDSIPDELFSGWDTLENLYLGTSTGPGLMQEYPVHLANHKNLKRLYVNYSGIYIGGPGFDAFVKDFREKHPEPGSYIFYC